MATNQRGVKPEILGPAPTAGPYVNQRFSRQGAVSNGASGAFRRNANDMRPTGNSPGLKRGR